MQQNRMVHRLAEKGEWREKRQGGVKHTSIIALMRASSDGVN